MLLIVTQKEEVGVQRENPTQSQRQHGRKEPDDQQLLLQNLRRQRNSSRSLRTIDNRRNVSENRKKMTNSIKQRRRRRNRPRKKKKKKKKRSSRLLQRNLWMWSYAFRSAVHVFSLLCTLIPNGGFFSTSRQREVFFLHNATKC
ncbi:uncharacterized protein LOC118470836 isoform X1 [Amphiprion ocellaris]|uniref:uncharacterized protein LOC118470836 isoform X1 n=1 Tax=Amphiprion ocellaris TaxID=80972 RepID=UPI0024116396|nr:uncharacterized protein LOC118470836 isoform X1 [Amphiprion ocellaris]